MLIIHPFILSILLDYIGKSGNYGNDEFFFFNLIEFDLSPLDALNSC